MNSFRKIIDITVVDREPEFCVAELTMDTLHEAWNISRTKYKSDWFYLQSPAGSHGRCRPLFAGSDEGGDHVGFMYFVDGKPVAVL